MPQNFENLPPNWDAIKEECELISLACPWITICKDGTLEFTITSLEWTFKYDFLDKSDCQFRRKPKYFEAN